MLLGIVIFIESHQNLKKYLQRFNKKKRRIFSSQRNVTNTRVDVRRQLAARINYLTTHAPYDSKYIKRHVAFLKVHKAASSTAQNIFLRFAKRRNLLIVVPNIKGEGYMNVISTGTTVTSENILPPPENRSYAILCCHVLYNSTAFQRIMPPDTVYIGIVREPFDQFISTLNYFRPKVVLEIDDPFPVSAFLQNPTKYISSMSTDYVNNRMALEYNFPMELFKSRNRTGIQEYITKLDKEFEFVIIVDLFDESLVLMRRLLNWGIKDVLYVKKNVKHTMFEKIKFKTGAVRLHRLWAELDYALYDHFFRRLKSQIYAQGNDFQEELLYFKRLTRDVESFCKTMSGVYSVKESKWSASFVVDKLDCEYMKLPETRFIKKMRAEQYGIPENQN